MTREKLTIGNIVVILRRVRCSYAPHWDPNLFRACDDHAKVFAAELPEEQRAGFLKDCGVKP